MKISNNANPNLNGLENSKLDKASDSSKSKDISAKSTDGVTTSSVDISSRAQLMNKAKSIASEQTVNQDKVDRLQKMIDSGSYSIDAASIADRLVDEHMLMGE